MADAYHHAVSSSKKWGGDPDEYLYIHSWFDETKNHFADNRHRAMRHHSEGIYMAISTFGPTITLSTGRVIPTRWIGVQHVMEDLGFIPTMADWLREMNLKPWMVERAEKLSRRIEL